MIDPVATERAEKELDNFINSRSKAKDKANAEADLWRTSEIKHREKQREEHRLAWYCFHLDQAERIRRTMEALISKHETAAAKLQEQLPRGERV